MSHKNWCTLMSTHNFGRKNKGEVTSTRLSGEAGRLFGGVHLQCLLFWHNGQVRVKSFVFRLKVCFMQPRTEKADILLRKGGKCIIQISGRFQTEGLHTALLGSERAFWAPSLSCVLRCACSVPCLYLLVMEVSHERKESDWEETFWLFFYLTLEPVTFGCNPDAMPQPHWVTHNEKHCFT